VTVPPPWRIVFLSTVQPAVSGLDTVARAAGHTPVAIVTSHGPQGRRDEAHAQRREFFNQLVWEAPPDLDIAIAHDRSSLAPLLAAFEPDLVLCLGFPWRVPADALAVPKLGIVDGHPSLLPKYRGPSPIAWQVRNSERELGMSYHRMDEDFDTGGVLAQGSLPLGDDDWIADLQPKLAGLSAELLARVRTARRRGSGSCTGQWAGELRRLLRRRVRRRRLVAADHGGPPAGASVALHLRLGSRAGGTARRTARPHRQIPMERGASRGRPGEILRRDGEALLVRCGEGALWVLETEQPAPIP
jgi:methionyl-tRNA formyltransferase